MTIDDLALLIGDLESKGTSTPDLVKIIMDWSLELCTRKNQDYGDAYKENRSILDKIGDKMRRIDRLEKLEAKGESPQVSEGVKSEYLDILNYAALAFIKLCMNEHAAENEESGSVPLILTGSMRAPGDVPSTTLEIRNDVHRIYPQINRAVLSDWEIADLCEGEKPLISPFVGEKVKQDEHGHKAISYGLGHYGYDLRIKPKFAVLRSNYLSYLDPKSNDHAWEVMDFSDKPDAIFVLEPNSIILTETVERFDMPNDLVGIVYTKSTYGRIGVCPPANPVLEPGWAGTLALTLVNNGRAPVRIYFNEGIAQVVFWRGQVPKQLYGDGKYQNQSGISFSKV